MTKTAARLQVGGRVVEARDLFVVGRQVRDGVADEVHEREPLGHPRRRRSLRCVTEMSAAPGSCAELLDHGGGQLDPGRRGRRARCKGTAMRPVPMPSSNAGPAPASSARRSTVASTSDGSNSSGHRVSNRRATQVSKCVSATSRPCRGSASRASRFPPCEPGYSKVIRVWLGPVVGVTGPAVPGLRLVADQLELAVLDLHEARTRGGPVGVGSSWVGGSCWRVQSIGAMRPPAV